MKICQDCKYWGIIPDESEYGFCTIIMKEVYYHQVCEGWTPRGDDEI
jgi:hypothetical protein